MTEYFFREEIHLCAHSRSGLIATIAQHFHKNAIDIESIQVNQDAEQAFIYIMTNHNKQALTALDELAEIKKITLNQVLLIKRKNWTNKTYRNIINQLSHDNITIKHFYTTYINDANHWVLACDQPRLARNIIENISMTEETLSPA